MKTLEELANEILHKLNFEKHKSTTQIVVEGLIEAQQQVIKLNMPAVSNLAYDFCDHLNTYDGMEEIRFDFMIQDFIDKSQ